MQISRIYHMRREYISHVTRALDERWEDSASKAGLGGPRATLGKYRLNLVTHLMAREWTLW
jgi:hypothetical protein